nr:MAG TPA: hypothetical protein [Caudoviricetes sp.]
MLPHHAPQTPEMNCIIEKNTLKIFNMILELALQPTHHKKLKD